MFWISITPFKAVLECFRKIEAATATLDQSVNPFVTALLASICIDLAVLQTKRIEVRRGIISDKTV